MAGFAERGAGPVNDGLVGPVIVGGRVVIVVVPISLAAFVFSSSVTVSVALAVPVVVPGVGTGRGKGDGRGFCGGGGEGRWDGAWSVSVSPLGDLEGVLVSGLVVLDGWWWGWVVSVFGEGLGRSGHGSGHVRSS